MRVGFSLSPGGLLLPYHVGVLDCLQHYGHLTAETPIAGSSAGAIASAAFGCGLKPATVLDATIDISDACRDLGGARGRLLPLLKAKLDNLIGKEEFDTLRRRPGATGVAYQEVFPRYRPVLQTEFNDPDDLKGAVAHSSTFPFFTLNWPVGLDDRSAVPRLVVDGFFTVPRDRFGCPDFAQAASTTSSAASTSGAGGVEVDRTVTVSVFPQEGIGLTAVDAVDCISPATDLQDEDQFGRLLRLATQPSSAKELFDVFDAGWKDAERWCRAEEEAAAAAVATKQQQQEREPQLSLELDPSAMLN